MYISADQIQQFRDVGYLHLPGVLVAEELSDLREEVTRLLDARAGLAPEVQQDFKFGAILGDAMNRGDAICRVEYMLAKGEVFVRLLGHPKILALAAALHDDQIVLTWEDMVVKTPGSGFEVVLHQDLLHQSIPGPVFSVGIYLDSSEDDPLRILPGTHHLGPLSQDELTGIAAKEAGRFVAVPAQPGDLVVHNVLGIHGSVPNYSASPRRVIYFEFRTVMQVLYHSPWGCEWLRRRLSYLPSAIAYRRASTGQVQDPPDLWDELLSTRRSWLPRAPVLPIEQLDLRVHHDPAIVPTGG
jgi:ectoine hydroxylase-related dioxygenase (phytanoyl-CoA dioxygenase family)